MASALASEHETAIGIAAEGGSGNHLQRAITLGTHHFGLWLAAEKDRAIKRSANAAPAR